MRRYAQYATVRIAGEGPVAYVDPGRYGVLSGEWTPPSDDARGAHPPTRDYRPEDGDVVFVTHVHHYDPDGIERVAAEDATVVAFEGIDVSGTRRPDTRPEDRGSAARALAGKLVIAARIDHYAGDLREGIHEELDGRMATIRARADP